MRWLVVIAGVACGLAACSGESAEEKAASSAAAANFEPPFVMSRLDFGGVIERRFRRLDRNHDDRLEPGEISNARRARVMAFDTNGDGFVSVEEWSKGQLGRFDAQDLNHDGTVTSGEREQARNGADDDLPTPKDEPANAAAPG